MESTKKPRNLRTGTLFISITGKQNIVDDERKYADTGDYAIGRIESIQLNAQGDRQYGVAFANGVGALLSQSEIDDPTQVHVIEPDKQINVLMGAQCVGNVGDSDICPAYATFALNLSSLERIHRCMLALRLAGAATIAVEQPIAWSQEWPELSIYNDRMFVRGLEGSVTDRSRCTATVYFEAFVMDENYDIEASGFELHEMLKLFVEAKDGAKVYPPDSDRSLPDLVAATDAEIDEMALQG